MSQQKIASSEIYAIGKPVHFNEEWYNPKHLPFHYAEVQNYNIYYIS